MAARSVETNEIRSFEPAAVHRVETRPQALLTGDARANAHQPSNDIALFASPDKRQHPEPVLSAAIQTPESESFPFLSGSALSTFQLVAGSSRKHEQCTSIPQRSRWPMPTGIPATESTPQPHGEILTSYSIRAATYSAIMMCELCWGHSELLGRESAEASILLGTRHDERAVAVMLGRYLVLAGSSKTRQVPCTFWSELYAWTDIYHLASRTISAPGALIQKLLHAHADGVQIKSRGEYMHDTYSRLK